MKKGSILSVLTTTLSLLLDLLTVRHPGLIQDESEQIMIEKAV